MAVIDSYSNSSCNFFEWVDEGDFEMEGSLQRKSEEVEVCIENVVLDLRKKKDKLKKKLEEERKKFQNDVGVFCIVMGINIYVLYSVCVEGHNAIQGYWQRGSFRIMDFFTLFQQPYFFCHPNHRFLWGSVPTSVFDSSSNCSMKMHEEEHDYGANWLVPEEEKAEGYKKNRKKGEEEGGGEKGKGKGRKGGRDYSNSRKGMTNMEATITIARTKVVPTNDREKGK
ncbi:uncharacterized protein HKW66_Vig0042340 [Vigna angularis]|uniref:Uncharacterized protein n=1 Tax=Phaseolus angularis TaxID=3914 RepID=A0A8T0KZV7_PHAAN|nr:uncharacterized protein HKW66_Vig0042340 [Vigna angularis]